MIHENKNHDNEQKFILSDKFAEDIKNLYSASGPVPPEIDMAILNKASQKFIRPRRGVRLLRWIGPAAAAAAIILFVYISKDEFEVKKYKAAQMEVSASASTDFDHNGRVDILDAFKLAKLIQSEKSVDKKWDINSDGFVNEGDVDNIALVAVSLN